MLYTESNRILRLFHHCSVDVKLALFLSYCTCFYCPFLYWTHYKKSNYSKLRVAFNNVYRRILKLPSRSSASTMYVVNNIDSLEVLVRKRIFGFMERLNNSDNTIIKCITNSWILRFDIWSPWNDLLLYTNNFFVIMSIYICHVSFYTIFCHCVYIFFLWVLKDLKKISLFLSLSFILARVLYIP